MFERLCIAAWLLVLGCAAAAEPLVRDPMQPYRPAETAQARAAAPRYALTAVLVSATRKVAVVNGRPYREGAQVDGAELVKIEPTAVHLHEHGATTVIRLAPAGSSVPRPEGETVR